MRARVWIRTLDYLVESCWLLAIVAVPIFFDTETTRIFEPDKIALFRNVVLVMLVALLLRGIITLPEAWARRAPAPVPVGVATDDGATPVAETARGATRPWWRRIVSGNPMLVPVAIFTAIYTLATVHSVLPGISFWGSYDRMQGLYTWLTYIAFFFVLAYRIRSWPQVERVISAIVFASVPVAIYGVMQHLGWDPVIWGADTRTRVASTLGNAIFIGAYLLMCLPFTAYRFWRALERFRGDATPAPAPAVVAAPVPATNGRGRSGNGNGNGAGRPAGGRAAQARPAQRSRQRDGTITISGLPPIVPLIGYALALMVSFAALYFSGSRGPYYGFLAGSVFVFGLAITLKTANPYPAMGAMVLDIILVAFPYIVNVLPPVVALLILLILVVCFVLLALRVVKLHPALAIAGAAIVILVFVPAVDVVAPAPATAAATASAVSSASADAAHLTNPGGADTQVRFFIWQGTKSLVTKGGIGKFFLGYGPESMIYVYSPYYPSGLGHLERSNAAPDRNHDVWLDFIVFSGVIGLLAWLGVLASFAYALYKTWRRPITRRATVVLAAVVGVVAGHLVEASVGIPVVSTLMLLWTMFALAAVFYLRPELGAAGLDVVTAAETVAASAVGAPTVTVGAGAAVATGRTGNGRTGNTGNGRNRGATATAARPRRAQPSPPVAQGGSFERLNGRQRGGVLAAIVVGLVATVGASVLFANNVQLVQADAVYKTAQGYDSAGTACLTHVAAPTDPSGLSCPYAGATAAKPQQILAAAGAPNTPYTQSGQGFIPFAIGLYQQAISDQPSQDMYYLWLGKAYLDEAKYYQILVSLGQTANKANMVTQFQSAEHVLKQAAALNPYNADHPMNLARMFTYWALTIDPSQWAYADAYYKIGTHITLHNGRFWDEWAYADIQQAARPGLALSQQRAILTRAIGEANHACQVDDLLGDARVYRGDAEQELAAITTNVTQKRRLLVQARDSYVEALKIAGFEKHSSAEVLQRLISLDAELGNYKALVTPLQAPDANGAPATGTPMTLAYSSTYALDGPASPFSATLQAISNTLRQQGRVK